MKKGPVQMYTCALCKKEFPFENIKYSQNGKKIVCVDCLKRSSATEVKKEDVKAVEKQAKKTPDSIKVACVDCRYKFNLKTNQNAKVMCPYCGGERLMKDDTSADQLINSLLREPSKNQSKASN